MGIACSSQNAVVQAEDKEQPAAKEIKYLYFKDVQDDDKIDVIRIFDGSTPEGMTKVLAKTMGTVPDNLIIRDHTGALMELTVCNLSNTRTEAYTCELLISTRSESKAAETMVLEKKKSSRGRKSLRADVKRASPQPEMASGVWEEDPPVEIPKKHPFPHYEFSKETYQYLRTPNFNVWKWTESEMLCLIFHMYLDLDILSSMDICHEAMEQFILAVKSTYRNNPFHNFRHAFCVVQMLYGLLYLLEMSDAFSKQELFCMLTAALCHDMDHPGYTNSYLINAKTALALRYNDKSPLENHHASMCFKIMSAPDRNILVNKSIEDYREIRKMIVGIILATDMADHATYVSDWNNIAKDFDRTSKDDRFILMKVMMKCCDISNEIRPAEVSDLWLDRLLDEYFKQGDKEREQGLPTLPFMDRSKTTRASAQVGFIQFVLLPLFSSLVPAFGNFINVLIEPLKESLERFKKIKDNEGPLIEKTVQKKMMAPDQLTKSASHHKLDPK